MTLKKKFKVFLFEILKKMSFSRLNFDLPPSQYGHSVEVITELFEYFARKPSKSHDELHHITKVNTQNKKKRDQTSLSSLDNNLTEYLFMSINRNTRITLVAGNMSQHRAEWIKGHDRWTLIWILTRHATMRQRTRSSTTRQRTFLRSRSNSF